MAKDFPCPCCCKHTKVSDKVWTNGGIVSCDHCGYKVKFPAHPNNPDDIMLKKKPVGAEPHVDFSKRGLTKEEFDAIFKKPETNPINLISDAYDSLNPKPFVEFHGKESKEKKPSVVVGLKFDF